MPVSYPEIKKFAGLYLQANSFTVPDGALEQADNIVITKDNKISKVHGYYQYFDPSTDTLNNLTEYQNKIITVMSDKVRYLTETGSSPNETATGTTLSGETVDVSGGRVSRFTQSNNNLLFTTNSGVMKLDAYNANVFKAGVPPALDMQGYLTNANGVLAGDSQTAYRVIFGRRDANDNLLLGSPSDILILTNSLEQDVSWTRLGGTVTVTNTAHDLITGMSIEVTESTGTHPVAVGSYTITVLTANTFTFSDGGTNDGPHTLSYKNTRGARLEFSVPSEISNVSQAYFAQIYRSSSTSGDTVSPSSDFKLVEEIRLTADQISGNIVFYNDEIDDILLGAELYTNPNSREGELQANDRPPLCDDLTFYKQHVIYASCTTRHLLNFQVVDTTAMVSGDFVEVKVDATTRRYVARTGVGNSNQSAESVSGVGTVTITYTSHGLQNGDTVLVSNVTGTVPEATYTVSGVTANTFDLTSPGNSATALDFQGVTNGTYGIFQLDNSSASFAVQLRNTAEGIVKAINRDDSSLVYARYTSLITDIPGQVQIQAKGFGGAIYVRSNSTASGAAFSPPFPDSFASGDQVYSRNEAQPHTWYASKTGEGEGVPFVNNFPTGSRSKKLLRAVALRDSLILIKEDGVFRCTGDSVDSFVITLLDNTIFCVSANTVQVLNNQVMFLSNQGVCVVTESAVQIVSRKIEDVIQPILGLSTISNESGAVGYESERSYFITTVKPNETAAGTTYIYNVLNDSWTAQSTLFRQGIVGPGDQIYAINTDNKIIRERKNNTKIDYCGQNYSVSVVAVLSTKVVTVSTSGIPEVGDVIVKSNVLNRINAVSQNGINYDVSFDNQHNLLVSDSVILYEGYESVVKMSPFHAGAVGRGKQFSQMQIHMRENSISRLKISFTGYVYGGSEEVEWNSVLISEGWGLSPWGFFPWGQEEFLNLTFQTQPAPVIRIYIPRFQQRNTFIQPVLTHKQAGEPMSIQALAYAVRGYAERVSK
jgi:hypothetical protein